MDGYDFSAYNKAGFGRFDDEFQKEAAKAATKNMKAPELEGGLKGWFNYFSSVAKLAPVPGDFKLGEVPEGVLRLGGTFVVSGDKILYRWSDRVPGDHPDINRVVDIAKEASSKKAGFLSSLFGQ